MHVEILYRPSYSLGMIRLEPGEEVQVEAGAMVSMSPGISVDTRATGGILRSLGRALLGGESFFQNTYRAPDEGGEIAVAPALPGDLVTVEMVGEDLMIQSGAYVASEAGVDLTTTWGGARTFFASEGLFMLQATGHGQVVLSSYGAIHERELAEGEDYTVDTGHLVAFSRRMGFDVRRIAGLKSTLFSGEGLVVDLTGPGRVLMQTRSQDAFLTWLVPHVQREIQVHRR